MSEFKFSCPNCQQNIAATSEYSGAQINCPNCQSPITVPAAPDAPRPAQGKLSVAASATSHGAAGTQYIAGPPVRKKKDRTKLYIGLAAGGCGILLVTLFWQPLSNLGHSTYAKYIHPVVVAQEPPPTNAPPPPPPDLATDEILQHVADTYQGLITFTVKGLSIASVNAAGAPRGAPPQTSTEGVSLELGRTNLYRLQWQVAGGATPFKGVAYSAGKGDYVGYGPYPATKTKNRQAALATASTASEAQCVNLAQLFFNDTNSLARQADAFAKTNGPDLATRINNRNCYVLDGEFPAHDLVLWVDKETFLIPQIQFVFGRKIDESTLKGMPLAQKNQLMAWSKLKGTITETYGVPETNKDMVASAFETDFAPSLTPQEIQGQPGPARPQRPRGASPTSPTQLTRRVREPAPQ